MDNISVKRYKGKFEMKLKGEKRENSVNLEVFCAFCKLSAIFYL